MIHWDYKNTQNVSDEKIEQAKENFVWKLGPYKQEFEDNGGYVELDFHNSPDAHASCTFSFKGDLGSLIDRINQHIRDNQ